MMRLIRLILGIIIFLSLVNFGGSQDIATNDIIPTQTTIIEAAKTTSATTEAPTTAEKKDTIGQQNALRSARDYLSFMPFSRQGLIDQLVYEGYSTEDATYAVDSINADWYEQAAKSAGDYLDLMPFSRQGLIDQLVYEGYSYEEAEYGVDSLNADWYEQAAKSAQNYLDLMAFSRQGLLDQLVYEGFSYDEAEYGVTAVGY